MTEFGGGQARARIFFVGTKLSRGAAMELVLSLMVVSCLATLLDSRKDDGWVMVQPMLQMARVVMDSMSATG